jgi:hypothetical protein
MDIPPFIPTSAKQQKRENSLDLAVVGNSAYNCLIGTSFFIHFSQV